MCNAEGYVHDASEAYSYYTVNTMLIPNAQPSDL